MAFKEIYISANSIKAGIETDAGPLKGSPSSLAGPLLDLSRTVKCFYITKVRFPYDPCPPEITMLVGQLETAFKDLLSIAEMIDGAEKQRDMKRPRRKRGKSRIQKCIEFFSGQDNEEWTDQGDWKNQDEWKSVGEAVPNGATLLQEVIARSVAARQTLARLDREHPLLSR